MYTGKNVKGLRSKPLGVSAGEKDKVQNKGAGR